MALTQKGLGASKRVSICRRNPTSNMRKHFKDLSLNQVPELLASAYDVGFVDNFRTDPPRVPVIERYGDRYVKWLYTSCLELALNETADVTPGVSMRFGNRELSLNALSEATIHFPEKDNLTYISLVDFLDESLHPEIRNRVLIIGLDSEQMPTIPTPIGPVKVHRAFFYGLVSLYSSPSSIGRN